MPMECIVKDTAPTVAADRIKLGDVWLHPGTGVAKMCVQVDPTVVYVGLGGSRSPVAVLDIPAGGTGATAGAYDTSGNRDAAITRINSALAQLRAQGLIS